MHAEILLKLGIVIQIFEFAEVVSVILCTALEGESSLFSTVSAHLEDGTALLKQQGASEQFSVLVTLCKQQKTFHAREVSATPFREDVWDEPCGDNSLVWLGEYKRERYEDMGLDALLLTNNRSVLPPRITAFLTRRLCRTRRMQDFTCPRGGTRAQYSFTMLQPACVEQSAANF